MWANVEQIAKLAAGAVLFLYITGIFAVNGYLFNLGVSDFSLVRIRFIYTGGLISAWALFGFGGIVVAILFVVAIWKGRSGRSRSRSILFVSLLALLIVPEYILFSTYFFGKLLLIAQPSQWYEIPSEAWKVNGLAILTGAAIVGIWRVALDSSEDDLGGRLVLIFLACVVSIFAWTFYVTNFMQLAYNKIPEQYGGGRPRSVQLLITKDALAGARQLGLDIATNSQVAAPANLLYESDQQYILQLDKGLVVRLDKKMVLGIAT